MSEGTRLSTNTEQRAARESVSGRPKLVFFHSPTSSGCRRLEGWLAQVLQHRRNHNAFELVRVNVEERSDLASRFGVESVPTLLVVEQRRVVRRIVQPSGSRQLTRELRSGFTSRSSTVRSGALSFAVRRRARRPPTDAPPTRPNALATSPLQTRDPAISGATHARATRAWGRPRLARGQQPARQRPHPARFGLSSRAGNRPQSCGRRVRSRDRRFSPRALDLLLCLVHRKNSPHQVPTRPPTFTRSSDRRTCPPRRKVGP